MADQENQAANIEAQQEEVPAHHIHSENEPLHAQAAEQQHQEAHQEA